MTLALTSSSSVATRQSSSKLTSSSSSSLSKAQASLALHSLERRFGSALAAPSVLGQGRDGERDLPEAAERQAECQPGLCVREHCGADAAGDDDDDGVREC